MGDASGMGGVGAPRQQVDVGVWGDAGETPFQCLEERQFHLLDRAWLEPMFEILRLIVPRQPRSMGISREEIKKDMDTWD